MDGLQQVALQVELPQVGQGLELVPFEAGELIAFQVEDRQRLEAVEGLVVNGVDARMVQVELLQVLTANEGVAVQLGEDVTIKEDFSGVHGELIGEVVEASTGTFSNVLGPGAVMIASAIVRAGHFTIASIEITTLAKSETMRRVGA